MNSYFEPLSPTQEFLEMMKYENSEYRDRILTAGAYLDMLIDTLCSKEKLDIERVRMCLDVMAAKLDCDSVDDEIRIERLKDYSRVKYWGIAGEEGIDE